jgi:hypothetical protein
VGINSVDKRIGGCLLFQAKRHNMILFIGAIIVKFAMMAATSDPIRPKIETPKIALLVLGALCTLG